MSGGIEDENRYEREMQKIDATMQMAILEVEETHREISAIMNALKAKLAHIGKELKEKR